MTVGLASLTHIVVLVILLCIPELSSRAQCRSDLQPFPLQDIDQLDSSVELMAALIEDCREILVADIRTLAVCLGWVMDLKEVLGKLLIGDHSWVVEDLDRFKVAALLGEYILIGGILNLAAGVAAGGLVYAVDAFKEMFDTPEASAGKYSTSLGRAFLEGHGDGVYAVAGIFLGQSLAEEYVSKMSVAGRTDYLCPSSVGIGMPGDGKGELLIKGGPPAIGLELVIRCVEGRSTLPAVVGSHLLVVGVFASIGAFCSLVDDHLPLLGIELFQQGLVYGLELESFTCSLWYVHRLHLRLLLF